MRRIVHYYPAAMGNSGVSFALWSWARAQTEAGFEVRVLHAPANDTGADVAFVSKECRRGLTTKAIHHHGGHRLTLRPSSLCRYLGRDDLHSCFMRDGSRTTSLPRQPLVAQACPMS